MQRSRRTRAVAAGETPTEAETPAKGAFHLHFGAGRLGMGLVFPAMSSSQVPFAVMQPPFDDFQPILDAKPARVDVLVNGNKPLKHGLQVVYDATVPAATVVARAGGQLILTDPNSEQWRELVATASTFSCSVGPALPRVLGPLLLTLPERPQGRRPVLYACENDHSAVEELAALLHSRVEVVPCMVDRICSDRSIKRSAITVVTEPYEGSIIPLTPSERLCAVDEDCREPLGGKSVFYPRTQAMADYRYQRKIFFVNHMHTTLALMTLCRHRSATNATAEEMLDYDGACVPLPLLNPDDVSDLQKLELRAWATAQILLLMQQFDLEVMMEAVDDCDSAEDLYRSLVVMAASRLKRFATVADTCDRVLGAGVACRFEGRLLPAYTAVKRMRQLDAPLWSSKSPESRVLHYAGLSIHDVFWSLERLVSEGRELAQADRAKRNGEEDEQERLTNPDRDGNPSPIQYNSPLEWLMCAALEVAPQAAGGDPMEIPQSFSDNT